MSEKKEKKKMKLWKKNCDWNCDRSGDSSYRSVFDHPEYVQPAGY